MTMQPGVDDLTIQLPLTFDYKGGRRENRRNKIVLTIIITFITVILMAGVLANENLEFAKKYGIAFLIFIISTSILRFFVFKEMVYSDIFESLKEVNFMPDTSCFWRIYDIDRDYPYICHYTNGLKGIFVRMEKDVIVGKSDTVMYDHFEGISEAYNAASSLNINMYHIDYMDNVGNDPRLKELYNELKEVENPEMQNILLDIYRNLEYEMSRNYSSFDIYVFFTRDKLENFVYNVQCICGEMLGGNFLSYSVLDANNIRQACMSLFNLHDFSIINARENLLREKTNVGIIAISIEHGDGTVEKINKTTEEKRIEEAERLRKEAEMKAEARHKRRSKRNNPKEVVDNDEDLNLF